VIQIKFNIKGTQILAATVKNSIARASLIPEFVHT